MWVQRVAPGSAPYLHRTVPNGSAELVCQVGASPWVIGPRTVPAQEVLAPGTTVVGIRFRPGTGSAVLGVPADELVDLSVDAAELWGAAAARIAGAVAAAGSPRAMTTALEAAVIGRLADAPDLDPVVVETVRRLMPGRTDEVRTLPLSLHISERNLRRRCQIAIGLAPKTLHRMLRFQGFLALAGTHRQPSAQLGRLAVEARFADQSHLNRESLRLAGRTPRSVLLESDQHCGCAHDHAASYRPLLPVR